MLVPRRSSVDEAQCILAKAEVPIRSRELRTRAPEAGVKYRGIGLSGQMHGAVIRNSADTPLRRAILWNDGCAGRQCAEIAKAAPEIAELAGIEPMPGFLAPKLLCLPHWEPQHFRSTAPPFTSPMAVDTAADGADVTVATNNVQAGEISCQ